MDIKNKKLKDEVVYKQGGSYNEIESESEESSPRVRQSFADNKKIILIGIGILLVSVSIVAVLKIFNKDETEGNETTASVEVSDTVKNIVGTSDIETEDNQEQIIISDNTATSKSMTYTEDEKSRLRAAGYTGDDIDKMATQGKPADDSLAEAKAQRSKYLQELYGELEPEAQDGASEAYNDLKANTWLGQNLRPVSKPSNEMFSTTTHRENCRYIKLPPKGGELFVKLTLKNSDYVFLTVHPDEYDKLDTEGNMVIDYDAISYGKEIYYFNIKEVPIN